MRAVLVGVLLMLLLRLKYAHKTWEEGMTSANLIVPTSSAARMAAAASAGNVLGRRIFASTVSVFASPLVKGRNAAMTGVATPAELAGTTKSATRMGFANARRTLASAETLAAPLVRYASRGLVVSPSARTRSVGTTAAEEAVAHATAMTRSARMGSASG